MKKQITILMFLMGSFSLGSKAQTAELQIIHNAADPAAATVDIYVDGTIAIDDFAFRTATTFLTLPAGVTLNVGVAPGSSTSVADTIKNFAVTLADGQRYVAIANGVLNPANFAPNPDAASTAFTLFVQDNIRNAAVNPSDVDFIAMHGATDAPTVDVIARNVATVVNDAPYGAITAYVSVPASDYILDVTPAGGSPIVASFQADLSSLGGGSAVVFASGFLDPSSNQNGEAFGLFAALANGTVVPFPATSQARLQVIHNAADPAAASVDVYVNGSLLLDDFAFRTASPYVDVPADVILNVGVAPGNSTSVSDTLKNFEVTLANGGTYLAVANGVLNPSSFAMNPDGRSTAFTLFLQDQMKETAATLSDVEIRVIHGASDAPTVDVLTGGNILVDNAAYGDITPYITVPANDYVLDITPGNNNSTIVASFLAPLTAAGGNSVVVLASGFLDPVNNQNGEPFALIAVFPDGSVVILSVPTSIEERPGRNNLSVYPNPVSDVVNVNLDNAVGQSTVKIMNVKSRVIKTLQSSGNNLSVNVSDLSSGVYFISVQNEKFSTVSKFVVD